MGLIVSFPSSERKPLVRSAKTVPDSGADILFFTGIRYSHRDWPNSGPNSGDDGGAPDSGPERGQTKPRRRKANRR